MKRPRQIRGLASEGVGAPKPAAWLLQYDQKQTHQRPMDGWCEPRRCFSESNLAGDPSMTKALPSKPCVSQRRSHFWRLASILRNRVAQKEPLQTEVRLDPGGARGSQHPPPCNGLEGYPDPGSDRRSRHNHRAECRCRTPKHHTNPTARVRCGRRLAENCSYILI